MPKTYVKGLAQNSDKLARYITKYHLSDATQVGQNPDLTGTIQAAALAALDACNILKDAVLWRQQP